MKKFEINGNLYDIENFDTFCDCIVKTRNIFIETFGEETMSRIDLYIDNATSYSGYTPITTVILNKYIIIKLGICDFSNTEQIVYQFAHELCHYVFYSLKVLNKEKANMIEENICSAMSLVIINALFPNNISKWTSYVSNLKNEKYKFGAYIARNIDFDITKLKNLIFNLCM